MTVRLDRHGACVVLTLDRPEVLNALNAVTMRDLAQAFDTVKRSDARCLILVGGGDRAFCAGADIAEIATESTEEFHARTVLGQRLFARLDRLRQPSIALVDGIALGGGCELALSATFRIATPRARFALPEIRLGLVPGYGGTQRLSRLIGPAAALDMLLSGRFVDAQEALRIGLVNRVLADTQPALDQAIAYADEFTGWSLAAQRLIRDAVADGAGRPLAEALEIEAAASARSYATADGRAGIAAFVAKRAARFVDQ